MADERHHNEDANEVSLDLDGQNEDIEAAMRDAVAAVEGVASGESQAAASDAVSDTVSDNHAEDEVGKLRREIADLRDRSMRTLADFDNFRKRSERERQDLKKYAQVEIIREYLGIIDNLDLALSAAGTASGTADDLKRGVEMIHRQMLDLLKRNGVKEISALGQPFDPAMHEAVSRDEDPTVKAPTVTGEMRRGYFIHDRLLRPAMVKVSVPAEPSRPEADPSA
jgi:molecular chaperone GrpE